MNRETWQAYDDLIQRDIALGHFREALATLVRGYQHVMVGFCANMLGDPDDGEEMAQEVFLAVYTAMPRFRGHASVRTWLFAIARKQCLKTLRNRRRRKRLQHDKRQAIAETSHREPPLAPGEDPEAQLQLLRNSLGRLDKAERALLLMRYDAGLPIADISHVLGLSIASVRRRLVRALYHLREVMDR